jgi:hypothetical protein
MRFDRTWGLLLVGAPLLVVAQIAGAQDPAPAPAAPTQTTSTPDAAAPAAQAAPAQTTSAPDAAPPAAQAAPAEPQAAAPAAAQTTPAAVVPAKGPVVDKKAKAKKVEYTGPNTVIVLPPKPMLDEEGKQRLDPDGQPMFYAAIRQQRDKKGHPLFDEAGKPVFQTATELGYDERGKKLHVVKVKEPKMIPVHIVRGTFTVDGMIGKAELNYEIPDFHYIYLWAPGIGTLVVSKDPFPGAKEEKNAFNDKTLTVNVGDHHLQVASDTRILSKKPESAFVLVDRDFTLPSKYPVVGYGGLVKAPYVWPGGRPNEELKGAFVEPPPIPVNLQPVLLLSPCPAGQMRKAAPAVLPGQVAPEQPCVLIPKGQATIQGPTMKSKNGAASAKPAAAPVPAATTPVAPAAPAPEAVPAPTPATTPSPSADAIPAPTPVPAATPAPANPQ